MSTEIIKRREGFKNKVNKLGYEEIVEKIVGEKGLGREEIEQRVREKQKQFSGLVSKDGALHIIANELGVKVFHDFEKKKLKIKDLVPGLRNVSVIGKVVRIYGVTEFSNEKRKGRVASFLIGDETGLVRIALWGEEHINLLSSIKEDDLVRIADGTVREGRMKEIHLSSKSSLVINPEGETIQYVREERSTRKAIKDLKENEFTSVRGTITQVFEPRFYESCPECNRKVELEDGRYSCQTHGNVAEKHVPVVNIVVDDGTENIRVVFFRELADKLLAGQSAEMRENNLLFENIKSELLGKEVEVAGKVTKNMMFDRLEFTANDFFDVEPVKEAYNILEELK